jgi:hypothetical protein
MTKETETMTKETPAMTPDPERGRPAPADPYLTKRDRRVIIGIAAVIHSTLPALIALHALGGV